MGGQHSMGGKHSTTDVMALEDVLRAQWLTVRQWVGELDEDDLARPSVLGDWSVADLVAHLGRAMDALAAAQPTEPGAVPQSLGEYLGAYRARAQQISDTTHELAERISEDPLAAVDRMVEAAFAQALVLRDLAPDPVVRGRGGPILLSDMLVSRLVELVVHADDLVRSTHRTAPGPLHDDAVGLVAAALLEVVVDRGGWQLEVVEPLTWIRLAAGREPYDVDVLAASIRAVHTSDSVPDLGTELPLI